MSKDTITDLFPPSALEGILFTENIREIPSHDRQIWRISTLLARVQDRLDLEFEVLWVEGEVSNLRRPSSGHYYFTLKDDRSQIKAVLFRSQAARLSFELEDGQQVVCLGRLNIYTGRGDLQLVLENVEPGGEGALQLAFEKLKARLAGQGMFSSEHKLSPPLVPDRVFVITSPTGAAIRDFIRTARGRYPGADIVLCPAKVQGDEAPAEIIDALRLVREVADRNDIVLLTRGGGSIEDLWAFNDETLAKEIFNCHVPVVSAVGHEVDFTISDFVADQRAATPTAAAQLLFPCAEDLINKVLILFRRITLSCLHKLEVIRQRVQLLHYRLRDPKRKLVEQRLRQDDLNARLARLLQAKIGSRHQAYLNLRERLVSREPGRQLALAKAGASSLSQRMMQAGLLSIERRRCRLAALSRELDAVSPLAVLARGYSLVSRVSGGEIVRRAEQVAQGERVLIRPERGAILCEVISTGGDQDNVLSKKN